MIQANIRLVAPEGKRQEILEVLQSLTGPTEFAKGCLGCRVYCDADDEDAITYWVQWDERNELDEHFRSVRFRQLLPYIEMSTQPPVVEIANSEVIGGIDLIVSAIGVPSG